MVKKISFFICFLMLLSFTLGFAGNDDMVQGYPGGDYGLNLGKGYQAMPDGELLEPRGYREDYKNTKYGPMTRDGFILFPRFTFSDSNKIIGKMKEKEEDTEEKEKIFEKAMQEEGETGSSLWGFSGPPSGKSKKGR